MKDYANSLMAESPAENEQAGSARDYASMFFEKMEQPIIEPTVANDMINSSLQYQRPRQHVPYMAKMGRGINDLGQGTKQAYLNVTDPEAGKAYTKEVTDEINLYEYDTGEGFDGVRMLGQALPALPLMLATAPASLPAMMGVGAVEGGVVSGVAFTKEGESKAKQVALGTAGGAISPALVKTATPAVTKAYDIFKRQIASLPRRKNVATTAIDDLATNIPAQFKANLADAANQQLKTNGEVDEAALTRMAEAADLGFIDNKAPMTGQLTRNPSLWTQERNLQKIDGVGDEITGRLMNQNEQFSDIFEELAKQTGRSADDVVESGASIITAVDKRFTDTQAAVGKLYQRAQQQYGNMDGITLDGFTSKLAELSDDASVDKIANSVNRRLQRYGLFDAEGTPTGNTLTIDQAEGLRKFINNLGDGNERSLKRVKGLIVDELDNDVFATIGDDVYAGARKAAKERFSEFEQKIVARITGGKMEADDAVKNIVKKHSIADLAALRDTLGKAEGGTQAWNNLRGEVIDMLNNAAMQGQAEGGAFSGTAYNKALQGLGMKKLQVLFPNDYEMLFKIGRVGNNLTRQPAFASVNHSNSASTLSNYIGSGLQSIPVINKALNLYGTNKSVNSALKGIAADPAIRKKALQEMNARIRDYRPMQYLTGASPVLGATLATQN